MAYHNTNNLQGEDLENASAKTDSQDEIVLAFFRKKKNEGKCFTPSQLWNKCFTVDTPLTSVRRSLRTLTKDKKLRKTPVMQPSPYGRPEHLWELVA